MQLKYQTAVATLIQFISLSFLGVVGGVSSVVTTCHTSHGSECLTNALSSVVFFMLTVLWFGFVWVLGYAAQERRSKRLAQALILAEMMIGLVALFDLRHHNDKLGFVTSLIDLCLAIWVIVLAFRLMRAKGGRIMTSQRARKRRHSTKSEL